MGWNKLKVRRGDMFRSGTTWGKGWNSVKAAKLTVVATAGTTDLEIRFDDLHQAGGPITGEVEYCYIYVRNDGTYNAKSAPSAVSPRYTFSSEGARISIPADASRDSQINEVWLFRRGAGLDDWYRVKVESIGGTGAILLEDTLSATDALIVNIKLEDDNDVPPDDIIDIEGPYFDRVFALTETHLYPSRRLNPDSFSASQVIQVAGADEVALWVKKALGGLYVGTTRDIYLLSGTGAELPDATLDFTLTPLNVDNPPQNSAVAQEGNFLVYFAADGWRGIEGGGSRLLTGMTTLLYRGKARHSVSAINMAGRFRAAIGRNQLFCITPEGADSESSTKVYRYNFTQDRWYRHIYPNALRCLYRDPDGNITASDTSGYVWVLDSGTQDDGVDIANVLFWTKEDDLGLPFARKDPHDFRVIADTGGDDASVAIHLDHATAAALTLTVNNATIDEELFNLTTLGLASFKHVQLRVSGSFTTFRWATLRMGYHPLPQMMRGHTPASNFGYPGVKTTVGLQLRVNTLGAAVVFTPVLDGSDDDTFTVTSATDEPTNYTHMFDYPARSVKEFQLKIAGDVELYDWKPIVTAQVPLGTLVWDSGPMDLGIGEFIWPREVWLKAVCGDDLYIEPYFDGVAFGAMQLVVPGNMRGTAGKFRVPLPRGYNGRVPRFVITSCEPFYPYWFEFVGRQTRAGLDKKPIRVPAEFGGKVQG